MAPRDLTGRLVRPRIESKLRLRADDGVPEFATFWAGRSHEPIAVPWGSLGIVLGPSPDVRCYWHVAFGDTIALAKRSDLEPIE